MEWSWVDTHCHLQLDSRPAAELLNRATDVAWVVVPGVEAASSRAALELATSFPDRILATAGLHPHEAERWPDEEDAITELAKKAAAIGETGLDFYRDHAPREDQWRAFEAQLELAARLDLPVAIHTRAAEEDTFAVLREHAARLPAVILHCFSAPARVAECVEQGYLCSFAGNVTYPKATDLQSAARELPSELLLVETDAPFLAPQPVRGRPNEPAHVAHTARFLAELREVPYEELEQAVEANAARVLSW